LESDDADRAMALISKLRVPMIDAGEHDVITHLLNDLAARMPNRLEPREWLVDTYGRMSDSFRLPDALSQLGDVLLANKQYPRAKEIFEQLVDKQPESDRAKRKLNNVLVKMGLKQPEPGDVQEEEETLQVRIAKLDGPKIPTDEPDPVGVQSRASGGAPISSFMEDPIDEETQKFIAQSLTDVDLFASYGLTQKAIGLLEAILRRAPRHTPTLEKLLDFVLGAGDDRRTAELAAQLEQIHKERGETAGAERFGELRRRFQRAAGISDEELMASQAAAQKSAAPPAEEEAFDVPLARAEPEPVAAAPAEEEVDLSDEWSAMLKEAAPPPSQAALSKAPAPAASEKPSEFEIPIEIEAPASSPTLEELSAQFAAPPAKRTPEPEDEPIAMSFDEAPAAALPPAPKAPPPPAAPPQPEPEFELEQDYELVIAPEPLVPAHEQKPPAPPPAAKPPAAAPLSANQFLADMVSEPAD